MTAFQFQAIGVLQSCFKEKFGIPRQSGMVSGAWGVIKLRPDPQFRLALGQLETFTHLWVVFVFHTHDPKDWRPVIRPPRIEALRKIGVLASRSPHRPNPIGLSAVKLERIDYDASGGIEIHVSGVDMIDGTPVLDIKPYLPFADSIPEAGSGWAKGEIPRIPVHFSEPSLAMIESKSHSKYPTLQLLITQILELDPRPTSQRRRDPPLHPSSEGLKFAFRLLDFDVQWEIRNQAFQVMALVDLARPDTDALSYLERD